MKLIVIFGSLTMSLAQLCSGAACTSGTLASYISLGAGGCTIGGNTLSNFGLDSGSNGALALSASSLTINPFGGSATPGLSFSTNQTVAANSMLESIFTYQIAGSLYSSLSISLANASETGDGGVTDQVNFCAGGAFGADGLNNCTGAPGTLLTVDPIQLADQSLFSSTSPVSITNDFILDGGTVGSASGGVFTNSLTASSSSSTPEPSSIWLSGGALLIAAFVCKRYSKPLRGVVSDQEESK